MNPEKEPPVSDGSLPVVDCDGCGVCCFHMGYPAFILPREPMTDAEIDADPDLVRRIKFDPQLRSELKSGNPGEPHWHSMPDTLRAEWESFVGGYQVPVYGSSPESFDGPCIWLDPDTRRCKNHAHRPRVCRDFSIGSAACQQWRAYYSDKIVLKRPDAN